MLFDTFLYITENIDTSSRGGVGWGVDMLRRNTNIKLIQ